MAAKAMEVSSMKGFQGILHHPKNDGKGDYQIRKGMVTTNMTPRMPVKSFTEKPAPSINKRHEDYLLTYPVDVAHSAIKLVYIELTVPARLIGPESADLFRIRWCDNLLHNYFKRIIFEIDKNPIDLFDSSWLDDHLQWFTARQAGPFADRDVGNLNQLTDWNCYLPEKKIKMVIPFFFHRNKAPFPLFFFRRKFNEILIQVEKRIDLNDLLKAEFLDSKDGVWKPFNKKKTLETILTKNDDPIDPMIEIHYQDYAQEEISKIIDQTKKEPYLYYLTRPISKKIIHEDKSVPVHTEYPVLALFGKCTPYKYADNKDYSSYSTSHREPFVEEKPIIKQIDISSEKYNESMSVDKANSCFNLEFFPSLPRKAGYIAVPIEEGWSHTGISTGKIFEKDLSISLNVTLNDEEGIDGEPVLASAEDAYKSLLEESGKNTSERKKNYIFMYNLLIQQVLRWKYNSQESDTFTFEVSPP